MARATAPGDGPVSGVQVVHLRILCPGDLTDAAVAVAREAPGACNIILLRDAGLSPHGDLLLCDVPDHVSLAYEAGRNPVRTVIKNGCVVVEDGRRTGQR